MVHHSSLAVLRWFVLLFMLVPLKKITRSNIAVSAQTFSNLCSAAQRLEPGVTIEGTPTVLDDDFPYSCDDGTTSSTFIDSEMQRGHWYSFRTELTESRIIEIQLAADVLGAAYALFSGSCDSLKCIEVVPLDTFQIENEVNMDYFLYVFAEYKTLPYAIAFVEIEPPPNDSIESATAITSQDLPYAESFTLLGARSDFELSACPLEDPYGVWFSFQTAFSTESVTFRVTDGFTIFSSIALHEIVNGDQIACLTWTSDSEIDWVAEFGKRYVILVANDGLEYVNAIDITVQSVPGLPVSSPTPTPEEDPTTVTDPPEVAPPAPTSPISATVPTPSPISASVPTPSSPTNVTTPGGASGPTTVPENSSSASPTSSTTTVTFASTTALLQMVLSLVLWIVFTTAAMENEG